MKHLSIFGKFFLLMAIFGLTALALTLYQSRQTFEISRSYEALLDRDAFAALNLSQSNRSLEAARASMGDLSNDTSGTDSPQGSPVRRIMAKVVNAFGMPNNVAEC
ncbi:hypothetical protein [Sinorhizobium americanum]|uniref:Uncharacterized protein n=1 Tax=Sinorhizobium americanum TaxID=194963 RepID=A0A1L3LU60_9HYPH|nr:hypothetical protein [Sinorhizobium americanum]APG87111.1 hypothetical protein SAMCCGM7_pB0396 [Sinorhizobium americanum CCGM7]APG93625.1 hypothetical protein SAMCFNEI73_pB0429 [Sinorhizobium americanum]OAP43981.1 hypothetical protein ATC00_27990 [Sinorhizobium americanum]